MAFRSHVGRDFSLRRPTHRLIFSIGLVTGLAAVLRWLSAPDALRVLWAPVLVGVVWALTREIDPDHDWTAIVAGSFAGLWALTVTPVASALAIGVLLIAARLMTETTGRRPLLTDLIVISAISIGIGYTPEGWVAGLGMATAMFVDDRRAWRRLPAQRWIAGATAAGSTLVAWLAGVAPPRDVGVALAMAAALAALALIARRPEEPTSVVDGRRETPLSRSRLHTSRAITGIVVYAMTVVAGVEDAEGTVPLIAVLTLVIISNEVERIRRRS